MSFQVMFTLIIQYTYSFLYRWIRRKYITSQLNLIVILRVQATKICKIKCVRQAAKNLIVLSNNLFSFIGSSFIPFTSV